MLVVVNFYFFGVIGMEAFKDLSHKDVGEECIQVTVSNNILCFESGVEGARA